MAGQVKKCNAPNILADEHFKGVRNAAIPPQADEIGFLKTLLGKSGLHRQKVPVLVNGITSRFTVLVCDAQSVFDRYQRVDG